MGQRPLQLVTTSCANLLFRGVAKLTGIRVLKLVKNKPLYTAQHIQVWRERMCAEGPNVLSAENGLLSVTEVEVVERRQVLGKVERLVRKFARSTGEGETAELAASGGFR